MYAAHTAPPWESQTTKANPTRYRPLVHGSFFTAKNVTPSSSATAFSKATPWRPKANVSPLASSAKARAQGTPFSKACAVPAPSSKAKNGSDPCSWFKRDPQSTPARKPAYVPRPPSRKLPSAPLPVSNLQESYPPPPPDMMIQEALGDKVWNMLKDVQKRAIRFALSHEGRALLCMDMGLGKTLTALAVVMYYAYWHPDPLDKRHPFPVVILCTSSVSHAWAGELERWFGIDAKPPPKEPKQPKEPKKPTEPKAPRKRKHKPKPTGIDQDGESIPPPPKRVKRVKQAKTPKAPKPIKQINVVGAKPLKAARDAGSLVPPGTKYIILTNDKAKGHVAQLLKLAPRTIICDESQAFKTPDSTRTVQITPLVQSAYFRIMTTGTPCGGKPVQLFGQLNMLRSDIFPLFDGPMDLTFAERRKLYSNTFAWQYCNPRNCPITKNDGTQGEITLYGSSRAKELNELLAKHIMFRALAEDAKCGIERDRFLVWMEIQDKTKRNEMKSELDELKAAKERLAELEATWRANARRLGAARPVAATRADNVERRLVDSQGMALMRKHARLKVKCATDWIRAFIRKRLAEPGVDPDATAIGGDKIIVVAYHEFVLNIIQGIVFHLLKDLESQIKPKFQTKPKPGDDPLQPNLAHMRIDGTVSAVGRKGRVDRFQSDPKCLVAILSHDAGGVGITLTAARHVLVLGIGVGDGVGLQQIEARAARLGQRHRVQVTYGLLRNSVDEISWARAKTKLGTVAKIVDGKKGARFDTVESTVHI